MKTPISLRRRLTLLSCSLAFGIALVVTILLHLRNERQLLLHLEKTLETRAHEVITVLQSGRPYPTLEEFLLIETKDADTYFYTIRDAQGRILARSRNLAGRELPMPSGWRPGDEAPAVHLHTAPHPVSSAGRIRLRSERARLAPGTREPTTVVIQTAVSLALFEATVRRTLRDALLVAAIGLSGVFFLLWFVTTRALQPVTAMTRKASEITATNLRHRLPLTGRGDELDELARVLNDMLDRLGGSLRQMEQFSSDAAHQLRTPLTRIRGELDLILRREDVSDPSRSQLEKVQEELEGMSRLCGRLLLLARLDQQAGGMGLCDERVDMQELAGEVIEQMTPVAEDRGISLCRDGGGSALVRGNRPLLVEALLNLLDNAVRFTPPGGQITVSTHSDGEAHLTVEDGGPGIPLEERERVFQRFYRLPRERASSTGDGGNGLGLAIVRAIAQAHGGSVEIAEAPRGGTLFRLVFPRLPDA